MPLKKMTLNTEADVERHEKILKILRDTQPGLSSSDDDDEDEEKIPSGQLCPPTDCFTMKSVLPFKPQSEVQPAPKSRDEPQSSSLVVKRPRSEAQIASLALARQSAKEKRRIRDNQREDAKVSSIAQEVARILEERRSLRRNRREEQLAERFATSTTSGLNGSRYCRTNTDFVVKSRKQPDRDRLYKEEEEEEEVRPRFLPPTRQVLRNPFD